MKTKVAFLFVVLLINIHVLGQTDKLFNFSYQTINDNSVIGLKNNIQHDEQINPFFEKLNDGRELQELWRLDSTVSYMFIFELDSFASSRGILTYDNANKTVEFVQLILRGTNLWENVARSVVVFNDNNKQIQNINFNWTQNQWIKNWKHEYLYDDRNRMISDSYYKWDLINEEWLANSKYEFEHNDQGLQTLFIMYFPHNETNELLPFQKQIMVYSTNGLIENETSLRWNSELNVWINTERITYFYEDGITTHSIDYWESNQWKHSSREEGRRIDYITVVYDTYHFEKNDSTWQYYNSYKIKLIRDENENIIFQESYRTVNTMNDWVGDVKYEKEFNEFGQLVSEIYYTWVANDEWIYRNKFKNKYNEHHIPVHFSFFNWSNTENQWITDHSSTSYYTNITAINETDDVNYLFNVYPNPCSNQLNINFENTSNGEVDYKIYSILGQEIAVGKLSLNNDKKIDITHLLKGFYLIKCSLGNKSYTEKFMKL